MSLRALASTWPLVLSVSLLAVACGGSDDEPPPQSSGKGGKGGKSGGGGKSAGGSAGSSAGGSSAGGTSAGGSSAGGTSAGGASAGGASAGGVNQGGSFPQGGTSAGGSSQGGDAGSSSGPIPCETSADCVGEVVPVCNPQTKLCVECQAAADCAGSIIGPQCDAKSGTCVECLSSADCTADPDRAVCDPALQRCVECLTESDCAAHPNGPHCDVGQGRCICKSNSECATSSKGKLCDVDVLRRCGECITAFDCKNPALPGCSLDDVCFKGDFCTGDDASEAGDDGPLGAVDITPPEPFDPDSGLPLPPPWSKQLDSRHVCDLPVEESDWYRVSAANGDQYDLTLDWSDPVDLDLIVQDSQGRLLGYDYNSQPARVRLTYLPAGTIYFYVYRSGEFDKVSATPTVYSITATRLPGLKCAGDADCGAEYQNQFLRRNCAPFTGECRFLEGNGNVGDGGPCDDDKDCESGKCSYQPFTRNAVARSFCAVNCELDPCPAAQRCATYLQPDLCIAPCAVDDDCHVELTSKPPAGQPWKHLACNAETGNCE